LRICREGDDRLDTDFGRFKTGAEWLEALDGHDWLPWLEPVENGIHSAV
jgi:hypothetical protein